MAEVLLSQNEDCGVDIQGALAYGIARAGPGTSRGSPGVKGAKSR